MFVSQAWIRTRESVGETSNMPVRFLTREEATDDYFQMHKMFDKTEVQRCPTEK